MSAAGYNDMLEKYRDVDEDEIMSGLTKDELARLENEIDREILEKPPEDESYESESYTTASTSSDESESEKEPIKEQPSQPERRPSRGKPEAFARGKLDKTQLKPVQKTLQRQKSKDKHTFKLPALKRTGGPKSDKKTPGEEGENALKDELIQAVKKRDKRRTRRGNSSGIARRPSCGVSRARRNSRIVRHRDGNEHQADANVNRNFVTDEMLTMRPRLRKVQVKEPKLVLPDELHGVSFARITSGARQKQEGVEEEEGEPDPEPDVSEDGDASRNSTFGYDADNDVTPSDDSYLPGDDNELEEMTSRHKAVSESSEAPSDGVATMASTASTSAESCDVFGELSINPNSVEEMLERVRENDPTLTEVNLNNIHDVPIERFEELAEAMEENTRVVSLLLANTGLTDRAAKAIASMLKKNRTLKKLNLESNFITGEGARRLVSALRKNNRITELSIDNQRHIFGAKVEHEMSRMLRDNTSLLRFGYQFSNPGPRMATSNILTKNMDIVRKKRVAEEKQRKQAGLPKRPQLRRQPSSEWYRRERLERLKKLQEQLNPSGVGIGAKDVEKVLKNMNPEEVSILERWFASKLLGMVENPPSVEQEKGKTAEDKKKSVEASPRENKLNKNTDAKDGNLEPIKLKPDNLLRPPARQRRSKSPPPSRDDLLHSIRNHNKKLKKVQLRPFESPSRLSNTDSEAEIQPTTRARGGEASKSTTQTKEGRNQADLPGLHSHQKKPSPLAETRSRHTALKPHEKRPDTTSEKIPEKSENKEPTPPQRPKLPYKAGGTRQSENLDSTSQSKIANTSAEKEEVKDATVTRPTIVTTEPSFDTSLEEPKETHSQTAELSSESGAHSVSDSDNAGKKSEGSACENGSQERSSSPEIREWEEGEEYDSDEYEIVEIEVTDSDEVEEQASEEVEQAPQEKERSVSRDTGCPTTGSNCDSDREQSPSTFSPLSSSKLAGNRLSPLPRSEPLSLAALRRDDSQPDRTKKRESIGSPELQSPGFRRSNPVSPVPPRSPCDTGFDSQLYNRSLSHGSNASSDGAKSSSAYSRPTPSRNVRSGTPRAPEDEPQINAKALSTIESFFQF